jgi:hypothetical protein
MSEMAFRKIIFSGMKNISFKNQLSNPIISRDSMLLRDSNVDEDDKIWLDTNSCEEYGDYPPDVLYSARYRDGLTADSSIYRQFMHDFSLTSWGEKFVEHCKVVYDYLKARDRPESAATPPTCAKDGPHVFIETFTTKSGHLGNMCMAAISHTNFLLYCMNNIEVIAK